MEVSYPPSPKTSIAPLAFGILCLVAGTLILLSGCGTPASGRPPLRTVAAVDLPRYSGRWYEIAAYPAWFQRKCSGGTTAEYTPLPDGSVRVVNRCLTANGQPEQVVGRATVVRGSGGAKLKVNFGIPFVTGDYWVIALDENNYRWAVVGNPSRKYLWILAREPHISDALYRQIVAAAMAQGYDPAPLRRTDQSRSL